ncbi:MAG: PAS domain S-box protein [Spirochaetaceae bacterium]|nr:PAS domain S-box protein [Spirochaetaceae bacterium]
MIITKTKNSIRDFFIIFMVLTIILPLLTLGIFSIIASAGSLQEEITKANTEQLAIINSNIEQYINSSIDELSSIKYLLDQGTVYDSSIMNFMLESITVSHDQILSTEISDENGILLNTYPHDPVRIGTDISGYEYFKRALISETGFWSSSFIPEQLDSPVSSISQPWKGGIVTTFFSLENLQSFVELSISHNQDRFITITDQRGVYIAHPEKDKVALRENDTSFRYFQKKWSGEPISETMTYNDGKYLTYVSIIDSAGWKVALYQNISTLRKPGLIMSAWIFLLTIIVLSFAYILAEKLINGITDSLNDLISTARNIADGNYQPQLPSMEFLEFNELSDSLTKMTEEIHLRETELIYSEQMQKNIINSIATVLIGIDGEGIVTLWNQHVEKTTGLKAAEAIGKHLDNVVPRLSEEMDKILEAIETDRKLENKRIPYEIDGEHHFENISVYPLTGNIRGAVIRIDDVTENVRIEEMMIQSEKMLSVGGLAAGMAHEINNPLAGVLQTASVMGNRLSDIKDIQSNIKAADEAGTSIESIKKYMKIRGIPRMISSINESGKRVAAIVENMLSFARKSEQQTSSYSLNTLIDRTIELAATDYDLKRDYDFKSIKIIREYDESLPEIPCEGAKIQQVLLNIFRNGAEAMNEAETKESRFVLRTKADLYNRKVFIEIEDNGPGMDEETQKRIFEPFFTTKPVGVGTGLGLSVSYFIITENHNGEMSVKSKKGVGSTFTISLPF